MKFRNQKTSLTDIKGQDMVLYLASLGFQPVKVKGNDYWYLSPLRTEKTASFKVNRRINKWYDHGLGKGGNVLDFALLYYQCTVGEYLRDFNNGALVCQAPQPIIQKQSEPRISVERDFILSSASLLHYLKERHISLSVAGRYCREVVYIFERSRYYAIGFKNDAGGYELRNKYFKGSCRPKAVTTIRNNATSLFVFEGFFDFLSYLSVSNETQPGADFLILNSLAFFDGSLPFMQAYETIHLFLDNDTAGQNCSRQACASDSRFKDESDLYKNYKDINDWLTANALPAR